MVSEENAIIQASEISMGFRKGQRRRKLRVCAVAYTVYDSDSRVMRYAEALVARGDQAEVVALRRPEQPRRVSIAGVDVFCGQARRNDERGKWSYLFRLLLFFVRSMFLMSVRHLRHRYDVIHVHSVPDFLVFTAWLPKIMGAKVILDIHDILPEFYASKFGTAESSITFKLLLLAERMSVAFADHVITANDLWQQKLVNRCVSPERATSLVNFPDTAIFSQRGRSRDDGKFIIIYPGSLNWHQGLDLAIQAFSTIAERVPAAEFHIYGNGPTLPSLRQLTTDLRLDDRVLFKPTLSLREISRVIENADLAVVPKRKDSFGNEAFSTKIMEFMALGVPVIVSDTKIDLYYFNDSIVRFFPGGNIDDLASTMLDLITNEETRVSLREKALQFAETNSWAWKKQIYFELLESLMMKGREIHRIPTAVGRT